MEGALPAGWLRVRTWLAGVIAAVAVAAAAGWTTYQQEARDLREGTVGLLGAIVAGKIEQMQEWRRERIGDLQYFSATHDLLPALAEERAGNSAGHAIAEMRRRLAALRESYRYTEAMLLDADLHVVAASPATISSIEPGDAEFLAAVVAARGPLIGEPIGETAAMAARVSMAAPILGPEGQVEALLLLRRDPSGDLFQMVRQFPSTRGSGEVVMFRPERNEVVYVGFRKFGDLLPFSFRMPLSDPDLIPAQVFRQGRAGPLDGKDYRGVPVTAVVRRVPDTDWFLSAKIDCDEMLAEARVRGWAVGIAAALLAAVLLVLTAAFFYRRERRNELRQEAALRHSEEQFREFAEFIPAFAWTLAADGYMTFLNRRWCEYTGRGFGPSLSQAAFDVIHPGDADRTSRVIRKALTDGAEFTVEHRVRRHDGVYHWFVMHGMPLRGPAGEITRWLGTSTDVDDLKNAEALLASRVEERTRELVAARDEAAAANRVKDIFLATMSHELRTPLNSIIGFTDLMLDGLSGPLTGEQRRQLNVVSRSGHQLLGLVSDVLDISKIERGQLDLRIESFGLRALLEEEWPAFAVEAAKRGLAVEAELPDASVTVRGDQRRVKQAVNNLLTNAIKYSDDGKITLRAGVDGAFAKIEVQDTGLGIPAGELPKIFQPFHRVPGPKGRLRDGSGLGLAITRRLIVLMGGQIDVKSEPGRGSLFWFTVPLAPAPSQA